jgi:TorA maturation chaperone TorD
VQTGGNDGALNGSAASLVKNFFRSAGFELDPGARELPDHISVELEFMAQAIRQEADSWEKGDRAAARGWAEHQSAFMKRHLGKWGPDFGEKIAARAETPLYREIARLLTNFLEADRKDID